MALEFQERQDGCRVVITENGIERMIANLETKYNAGSIRQGPMSPEEFSARSLAVGVEVALTERDARANGGSAVTKWEPLPRAKCTIHSAIGPLPVAYIEEMLAFLPAE